MMKKLNFIITIIIIITTIMKRHSEAKMVCLLYRSVKLDSIYFYGLSTVMAAMAAALLLKGL